MGLGKKKLDQNLTKILPNLTKFDQNFTKIYDWEKFGTRQLNLFWSTACVQNMGDVALAVWVLQPAEVQNFSVLALTNSRKMLFL